MSLKVAIHGYEWSRCHTHNKKELLKFLLILKKIYNNTSLKSTIFQNSILNYFSVNLIFKIIIYFYFVTHCSINKVRADTCSVWFTNVSPPKFNKTYSTEGNCKYLLNK